MKVFDSPHEEIGPSEYLLPTLDWCNDNFLISQQPDETPEYLVLLNPSETTGKISPSPPQYQPPYSTGPPPADVDESPEYADYADLDELEEISAKEASSRTSDLVPSYSAPLYNVHGETGNDFAGAPMYDVLEGQDLGFASPMYAVLEGPDTNWIERNLCLEPLGFFLIMYDVKLTSKDLTAHSKT